MSWGTCYSGSNNIHFDYPPIMNDGRNFATWVPANEVSENIRTKANIQNNNEYRQYLVNNSDSIIRNNQVTACDQCCYCSASNVGPPVTNNKYLYKSSSDSSAPFGYESSDLKNLYLSRNELQSKMIAPIVNQEDILRRTNM